MMRYCVQLLVASSLMIGLLSSCDEDDAASSQEVEREEGASQKVEPEAPSAPVWPADEIQRYALELSSHYGAADGAAVFSFELAATATLQPVARQENQIDFLLRLADPKLTAEKGGDDVDATRIAGQLEGPFVFRLVDGRLDDGWFAQDTDPMVLTIVRTVASGVQHVAAKDGNGAGEGAQWEAVEHDATGSYRVRYARKAPGHIQRKKLAYQSWNASTEAKKQLGGGLKPPEVIRSIFEVHRNGERVVEKVSLSETLATSFGLKSVTEMSLQHQASSAASFSSEALSKLRGTLRRVAVDDPGMAQASSTRVEAAMDRAKAASMSFDRILETFAARAAAEDREANQDPSTKGAQDPQADQEAELSTNEVTAFAALSAKLRTKPERAAKVKQLVRKGSPASRALISGLGAAGTAQGHEALLSLMDDSAVSEELQTACGVALLRTPKPSKVAIEGVASKLDDPDWHRLAVYGLGSYSRRVREAGDTKEAARLVAMLTDRLDDAKTSVEKADLLRGISNAAAPETFDIIEPYATGGGKKLRAGAMTALRLIDDPRVDAILAEALRSDAEGDVRLAALRALDDRDATADTKKALIEAARSDASTRIRYEAIKLMRRWQSDAPELKGVLAKIAQNEENEYARSLAAR